MAVGQSHGSISLSQIGDRVDRAGKTISYAAVREVKIRTSNGTRSFEERILRSNGMLYLSYPSDSAYADQQIYEKNGKRYTYTRSNNELRYAPSRGGFMEAVELLRSSNGADGCIVKSGDAVASRPTIYVEIPSSRGRGGSHRMWIDREKYVILKRSFGAGDQEEVGGFEVTRIDYSARIPSYKFNWPKGAKVISVVDDLRRIAKELGLKPMYLRTSGKMELASVGQIDFRGQKILRQFYVDGEKQLSLFVMKQTDDKIEFRSSRTRVYQWESAGMTLFLIGDYTEIELQRFAKAVKT